MRKGTSVLALATQCAGVKRLVKTNAARLLCSNLSSANVGRRNPRTIKARQNRGYDRLVVASGKNLAEAAGMFAMNMAQMASWVGR